jgi:hypothetical protein
MPVQIYDNGASLFFVRDGVAHLLMKRGIREISIVGPGIIKIDRGSFERTLTVPFADITSPSFQDVVSLVDELAQMVTGCLCNGFSGNAGG